MTSLASDVAKNVATQLSKWRSAGLENVFGEAVLILTAAQYLKERQGYDVEAEVSACKIFRNMDTKLGEVNYDLHTTKNDRKIIWEMKFPKKSINQRIIYDLVKLALPDATSDYQRLFLIACNNKNKSTLVARMDNDHNYEFDISRDAARNLLCLSGLAETTKQPEVLTPGSSLREVDKCLGIRQRLRFQIHREATEKIDSDIVMIFSVVPN